MKNIIKKGFTLIELLVVITIIWILATGAASIYTSQIQKARDSTRIQDINALRASIEQASQDEQEYPDTTTSEFKTSLENYIDKFPEDPKFLKPWNKSWYGTDAKAPALWYVYNVWADSNWIDNSIYEISTSFEANWNIEWKAKKDKWNDDNRLEVWHTAWNLNTTLKRNFITCTTAVTSADPAKWLVIHSNPDQMCQAGTY